MVVVQYLTYLVCGFLLLFVIGAVMSVAAGFGALGVVLIFFPLLLVGVCPSLSFFAPRATAIAAIVFAMPFLFVAIHDYADRPPAAEPTFYFVPSLLVIAVSAIALRRKRTSVWRTRNSTATRVAMTVFAAIPLLFIVFSVVRFFSQITFN